MAEKKSVRERELEAQIEALREQMTAFMAGAASQQPTRGNTSGKPVVGIRNISSYTIGLVNKIPGEEGEVQVHAAFPGQFNPLSRVVISYQFWQQIRAGDHVRKGMLIRDDSFLVGANVGPEDSVADYPADAFKNRVEDPHAWIESRTEDEIKAGIAAMTSEPSVRRLIAAVDAKVWSIGEEKYREDEQRAKKAVRDLPGVYRLVEQLAFERLMEMSPNAKNYENESRTTARL